MEILEKEVLDNHKKYLERVEFYRGFGYDLERERELIVDRSLPFEGKILEIGTGKGHFAISLAKRGFSFISVDISSQEQEMASLNLRYNCLEKQVTLMTADACALDFPNASFDTIFSVNVLHHAKNPTGLLSKIDRLIRPGGKVVLSDFNQKGIEIINACHEHEGKKHDHCGYRLEQARDYFLAKGYKVKESRSKVQDIMIAEKV